MKQESLFKSLLSADPKSSSVTRFAVLVNLIVTNLIFFVIWIILNVIANWNAPFDKVHMIDIPEGAIWIYALANGISLGGKVAQKFVERGSDTMPPSMGDETLPDESQEAK